MICSLILGALIGWIASKLMGSRGGLIRNLILGVVGSAVGNWLGGHHRALPPPALWEPSSSAWAGPAL